MPVPTRTYDGSHAGRTIIPVIKKARSHLWICSPFIGPQYAKMLDSKAKTGTDVKVLTTNAPGGGHQQALAILQGIKQERSGSSALAVAAIGFAVALVGLAATKMVLVGFGGLLVVVGILWAAARPRRAPQAESRIELKISRKFIHSKMYIADEEVAAVGSPNLTASGMGHNTEHLEVYHGVDATRHVVQSFMKLWNSED